MKLCGNLAIRVTAVLSIGFLSGPVTAADAQHPSLSNGFEYGMSPKDVVAVLARATGVTNAKAAGSSNNPHIKVTYAEGYLNRLGINYTYDFTFYLGKLVSVNLVGQQGCSHSVESQAEVIAGKFSTLYGKPDDAGVFHAAGTDVYVFTKGAIPEPPGEPFLGNDLNSVMEQGKYKVEVAEMRAHCGEDFFKQIFITYKGNVAVAAPAIDPTVVQAALAAKAKKDKDDSDALSLPK